VSWRRYGGVITARSATSLLDQILKDIPLGGEARPALDDRRAIAAHLRKRLQRK